MIKKVNPQEVMVDEQGIWFVNENQGIRKERIKEIKILELRQGKLRTLILYFAVFFILMSAFISMWFIPIATFLLYLILFPKKVVRIELNDGSFIDLTADDFDTLKKLFLPLSKKEKPMVELQDALRKRLPFLQSHQ